MFFLKFFKKLFEEMALTKRDFKNLLTEFTELTGKGFKNFHTGLTEFHGAHGEGIWDLIQYLFFLI